VQFYSIFIILNILQNTINLFSFCSLSNINMGLSYANTEGDKTIKTSY